jgi:hypothetical protein
MAALLQIGRMTHPLPESISGASFHDRDGQRWWVRGPRPGAENQFVVEAEMKGSYPRIAQYVMTERQFREHARMAELKLDRPGAASAGRTSSRRTGP